MTEAFENSILEKEIAPGVILSRLMEKEDNNSNSPGLCIWKIYITAMSIVDIEVSFAGSENIELASSKDSLVAKTQIMPFEKKDIARIRLYEGFKMKSKLKITMSVPEKEIQIKFIQNDAIKLKSIENDCKNKLSAYPLELFTSKEIDNILTKKGVNKFVDYDFPPNDVSVFNPIYGDNIKDEFEYLIHWRTPNDFILLSDDEENEVKVIDGNDPEPNGVFINTFPDCNFASALSGMTENYNLIRRIFDSVETSKFGIYQLRLFIRGEQKTFIVDDLFPCIPMNNPFVACSPSNEIWVLLIEKALAKAFESYYSLLYLSITDFLLILTGLPTMLFQLNELTNQLGKKGLIGKLVNYVNSRKFLAIASMNNDIGQDESEALILPKYGYTLLEVIEREETCFILLRKIWFEEGKEINWNNYKKNLSEKYPSFDLELDDGMMIIEIDDFIREFSSLSVCYTMNWEEIRLRGRFIYAKESKLTNYEQCISQWYYSFNLPSPSTVIVSLFQDEDKFKESYSRKQIMDISLTILSHDISTNQISLVQTIDFVCTSNIQQELNLPKGNYIILPRSSGCFIGKPVDIAINEVVELYDKSQKKFIPLFENVIKDIFRKFDIQLNQKLSYDEFKELYELMTKSPIDKGKFESQILQNYQSDDKGITEKGLIQYFLNFYNKQGEEIIREWLSNLGYNDELYCNSSRSFVLSVHSDKAIQLEMKEVKNSEINSKVNKILLKNFGEMRENGHKVIKPMLFQSKLNNIVTVGCINNSQQNLKVKLTLNNVNEVILGNKNGMERIIKGKEIEYFCQLFLLIPDKLDTIEYLIETQAA